MNRSTKRNRERKKIRLSQCMIVKNEEENIERALSWGRSVMWEQIVVDTGSSDRTVEIAESMGAKVYHFAWCDDFAAAKNYAIAQAGGDWIAFLDADEYLTEEMAEKLPQLLADLQDSPYMAIMSELLNLNDEGKVFCGGNQLRFFRNVPELCYEGRIHERLFFKGRTLNINEVVNASEEFSIFHTGYASSVVDGRGKKERNRKLLMEELESRPNDRELIAYIGDTYFISGGQEESCRWFEKAIEMMPEEPLPYNERDSLTFSSLIGLLAVKDDEKRMMEIYDRAVKRLTWDGDFDYLVGRYYVVKEKYEKGIYHLERALRLLEEHGNAFCSLRLSTSVGNVWELLAAAYYNIGKLNECVRSASMLLKIEPYVIQTLIILLNAFKTDARRYEKALSEAEPGVPVSPAATGAQVLGFLGGIYDLTSDKDKVFILRAAAESEYEDLLCEIRKYFAPELLEALERAMKQKKDAEQDAEKNA